jgi:predicted AlkP superfamily phosphohydrolase/phosphomutase
MSGKRKTIIIGIDGVPFRLMDALSRQGVMPNFAQLRQDGVFRQIESSLPEISSVSWSSIITGKNPGEHGIFGFAEMIPGTYTLSFPNFDSLRAKPFWRTGKKKRYAIINVPSTYPAKPINGFHVAGFIALDLERATYPPSYVPKLREMGYRIDIDAEKGHKSKTLLLKELSDTLDGRMKLYRHLLGTQHFDVTMIVFTGTDRIGHFMFDAYESKEHPLHQQFLDYFTAIDKAVGEIVEKMKPDDNLLMCSDHGMELIEKNLYVNKILQEKGFLNLGDEENRRYNNIKQGTLAFSLDPARIYLNRAGRYPKGGVRPADEEKALNDIIELFRDLKIQGKKAIKAVHRKEEIYKGPCTDRAPDLVMIPNKGFNLKSSLTPGGEDGALTGKHTQHDAFLFIKNKNNENVVPKNPKVQDITGMLGKIGDL